MAFEIICLILFWIISAVHMFGETLETQIKQKIRHITKPVLMPLLLLYYILGATAPNGLIIGGILLGWVGDVVLMFPEKPVCFIIGLGSFLLGHVLFIIAFLKPTGNLSLVPGWFFVTIIVYLGLYWLLFRYFKPFLKDMVIPVAVYMFLILLMSFTSLGIVVTGNGASIGGATVPWALFIGSICFIASDMVLAMQIFIKKRKFDQVFIMFTYLMAQFLIAYGFF